MASIVHEEHYYEVVNDHSSSHRKIWKIERKIWVKSDDMQFAVFGLNGHINYLPNLANLVAKVGFLGVQRNKFLTSMSQSLLTNGDNGNRYNSGRRSVRCCRPARRPVRRNPSSSQMLSSSPSSSQTKSVI